MQGIQPKLFQRRLGKGDVRMMGRIKCPTEHTDAPGFASSLSAQTQSRLMRNSL